MPLKILSEFLKKKTLFSSNICTLSPTGAGEEAKQRKSIGVPRMNFKLAFLMWTAYGCLPGKEERVLRSCLSGS
jgi:hypothetical protein